MSYHIIYIAPLPFYAAQSDRWSAENRFITLELVQVHRTIARRGFAPVVFSAW